VKCLQVSLDTEGNNPNPFVLPHANRDLGLGNEDQEDMEP